MRGLLLYGKREAMQPMATRLARGDPGADAYDGAVNGFRLGLEQQALAYVVQVPGTISAYAEDVAPQTVSSPGRGRPSLHPLPPAALVAAAAGGRRGRAGGHHGQLARRRRRAAAARPVRGA